MDVRILLYFETVMNRDNDLRIIVEVDGSIKSFRNALFTFFVAVCKV